MDKKIFEALWGFLASLNFIVSGMNISAFAEHREPHLLFFAIFTILVGCLMLGLLMDSSSKQGGNN